MRKNRHFRYSCYQSHGFGNDCQTFLPLFLIYLSDGWVLEYHIQYNTIQKVPEHADNQTIEIDFPVNDSLLVTL